MKKLIIFGVIAIFLVVSVGIVIASGNAAPKVTGDVWFTTTDGYPRHIWFDVHEDYASRPVKGEFHQEDWCGGVYHYYNGYITEADVDSAGGYANFATYITDTNTGKTGATLYLHVFDGGEPGIGVDTVDGGWDADYSKYTAAWPIYEGNLVVHN